MCDMHHKQKCVNSRGVLQIPKRQCPCLGMSRGMNDLHWDISSRLPIASRAASGWRGVAFRVSQSRGRAKARSAPSTYCISSLRPPERRRRRCRCTSSVNQSAGSTPAGGLSSSSSAAHPRRTHRRARRPSLAVAAEQRRLAAAASSGRQSDERHSRTPTHSESRALTRRPLC